MVNLSSRDRTELEKLCREAESNLKTEVYNAVQNLKQSLPFRGIKTVPESDFAARAVLYLSTGDLRAVKYFARNFNSPKGEDLSSVCLFILRLALSRPAVVQSWLEGLAHYCSAEDLQQKSFLAASVAAQRKYRRVKLSHL